MSFLLRARFHRTHALAAVTVSQAVVLLSLWSCSDTSSPAVVAAPDGSPPDSSQPPDARPTKDSSPAPDSSEASPDVEIPDSSPADSSDAGADAPPAADGGDGGPVRVTNVTKAVCGVNWTYPLAGEFGHWYATRLTPPSYPFVVSQIDYELVHGLFGGTQCHADFAHRVQLYKAASPAGGTPPTTPTVLATLNVSAGAASDHVNTLPLPSPISLAAGEDLFIAVEMVGEPDPDGGTLRVTCLSICGGQASPPIDRDWWSGAVNPPFTNWRTLRSFGIAVPSVVGMTGN